MMQTFSRFRFPHAVLTSCAAVLLSLGGASPAAAAPSAGDTFPQDRQDLLKNKKYQQGLKALENRLPLEASKHFQECLSSQNLAESQKAIIRPFLAEALIRAKKTEEGLNAWEQLPDSPMKSYWTAVGLFNKGSFTKALEKLTAIPETDPLSPETFMLFPLLEKAHVSVVVEKPKAVVCVLYDPVLREKTGPFPSWRLETSITKE